MNLANAWILIPTSLIVIVFAMGLIGMTRIPLAYSIRNLTVRLQTTVLTAVSFTLVIGVLTLLLGFVNGLRKLTLNSGNPSNVIVLSEGATDEGISSLASEEIKEIAQLSQISRLDGQSVASLETYMVVVQPIEETSTRKASTRLIQIRGLDNPYLASLVRGLQLHEGGEWFSEAGVREMERASTEFPIVEVVLGEGLARELSRDRTEAERKLAKNPNRLDAGDLFQLDQRKWLVVGVLKSAGTTFDSEVWARRNLTSTVFGKPNYTTLAVKTNGPSQAIELQRYLNGVDESHKYTKTQVNAFTEPAYFQSLGAMNQQLILGTNFVVAIMAIGGIFGIMNTMFAAVSQRVNDIGVLRLIGFSRFGILVSFLLESILIATIGGILGCGLGYLANGLSMTSTVGTSSGAAKSVVFQVAVDASVVGIGVFFSLAIGLLGGILPALSAMRGKPTKSLG